MRKAKKMKQVLNTENAPKALGPYSQGIKAGCLIFLSGQLGLDPGTGELVQGGIQQETRQALINVRNILEAAGSGLDWVMKTTVFLRDMNDFSLMNQVYAEFFTQDFPARSTVQAAGLPKNAAVEIETIAIRRAEQGGDDA